jgi:hypothetical protein
MCQADVPGLAFSTVVGLLVCAPADAALIKIETSTATRNKATTLMVLTYSEHRLPPQGGSLPSHRAERTMAIRSGDLVCQHERGAEHKMKWRQMASRQHLIATAYRTLAKLKQGGSHNMTIRATHCRLQPPVVASSQNNFAGDESVCFFGPVHTGIRFTDEARGMVVLCALTMCRLLGFDVANNSWSARLHFLPVCCRSYLRPTTNCIHPLGTAIASTIR